MKTQTVVEEFCRERDWDQFHSAKDLAIGLVTESVELLEFFRFKDEQECLNILKVDSSRQRIGEELADVLFFLLRFSQRFNFDLEKSFASKMAENARKYPVEIARGSNKKYNEF